MRYPIPLAAACSLGLGAWLVFTPADPASAFPELSTAASEAQAEEIEPGLVRRTARPHARGPFGAPAGSRFVFDVRRTTETAMQRAAGSALGGARFDVRGRLEVVVRDRRQDECIVGIRMLDPDVTGTTGASDRERRTFARDLELGCLLRMRSDGTPLGYRFAEDVTPSNRDQLRALVAQMTFVVAAGHAWQSREPDATGTARVQYRWDTDQRVLSKVKTAYEAKHPDDAIPAVRHTATGTFDPRHSWLSGARVQEQLVLPLDRAKLVVRITSKASFSLALASTVEPIRDDPLWRAAWLPVTGGSADVDDQRELDARDRRALALTTCAASARALAAVLQTKPRDTKSLLALRADLVRQLQLFPERLHQLQPLILAALHTPELASILISAAGESGTPRAQNLLAGFAADRALPEGMRTASLTCLSQVRRPTPELFSALTDLAAARHTAPPVFATSMLILGALAPRAEHPERHLQRLYDLETPAQRRGLLESWFAALGNTRAADNVAIASRYLQSRDPNLAATSLQALRHVRTTKSQELLLTASRSSAPAVRAQAIELLSAHGHAAGLARVVTLVSEDGDESVRRAALRALGDRARDPAVRRVLERVASSGRTERLRNEARRFL